MATSVVNPRAQFFANNGRPLIGGRIHTYVAGSSTRARTYKDAAKAQPNTNPIVLDGRGEAQIYLAEGVEYKFVVEDSKGALIYTQEPVYGAIWPNAEQWPSDATLSYRYMTEAKAAVDSMGVTRAAFDTYAQAAAALPELAEGERIEVSIDETRGKDRVRYKVEGGELVFVVNLDQIRADLRAPSGAELIGYKESTVANKLQEFITIVDEGGSQESSAAVNDAAIAACIDKVGRAVIPSGEFAVTTQSLALIEQLRGDGVLVIDGQKLPLGDITDLSIFFPGVFSDWRDLWRYLDTRRILGSLTINVVSNYTFDGHWIEPRHPDGARVKIIGQGSALTRFTFINLPPAGKAAGAKCSDGYSLGLIDRITLDGNNWDGHSSGSPDDGPGHPDDPMGMLAIMGGSIAAGSDVVIYRFARNGALTYTGGHIFAPNLKATECGSDGFVASTNGSTVVTRGVADGCYGFGFYSDYLGGLWADNSEARNTKQRAGVGGSGYGVAHGGSLRAHNSRSIKNSVDGYANLGGVLNIDGSISGGAVIEANGGRGLRSNAGGKTYAANFTTSHNGSEGLNLQSGATFFGDALISKNNGGSGIYAGTGCVIESSSAESSNNIGAGIVVEKSAAISLPNLTADGNTSHGVNATGCTVHIRTAASIKNNGGYGVQARYGGCVDLRSTNKSTAMTGNVLGAVSATEVTGTGIPQSIVWLSS